MWLLFVHSVSTAFSTTWLWQIQRICICVHLWHSAVFVSSERKVQILSEHQCSAPSNFMSADRWQCLCMFMWNYKYTGVFTWPLCKNGLFWHLLSERGLWENLGSKTHHSSVICTYLFKIRVTHWAQRMLSFSLTRLCRWPSLTARSTAVQWA